MSSSKLSVSEASITPHMQQLDCGAVSWIGGNEIDGYLFVYRAARLEDGRWHLTVCRIERCGDVDVPVLCDLGVYAGCLRSAVAVSLRNAVSFFAAAGGGAVDGEEGSVGAA